MIIPNKNKRTWGKVIEDIGLTAVAVGSKINFRTLKRAVDTGKCKDDVFMSVESFMSKRKAKVKKMLSKDQD